MANSFVPSINYTEMVDRTWAKFDKTNVFKKAIEYQNGEYKIMKADLDGLGNYTREDGTGSGAYAEAYATQTWETVSADTIRSAQIKIDIFDNMEVQNKAFSEAVYNLGQKAAIEAMVRRHAAIANAVTPKEETIASAADLIASLRATVNAMDSAWVTGPKVLIIELSKLSAIEDLDSYKSKEVLSHFDEIIPVPASVLYDKITLANRGGWSVPEDAKAINYIAASKDAIVTGSYKNIDIFNPEVVQDFHGYKLNYVEYPLDAHVYDNKADGVIVSVEE